MFRGYTLTLDCGRRGSMLGKSGRGFILSGGRTAAVKNNEVTISDRDRTILVHSKPTKSERVRYALFALSKTALDRIYFKSYRISPRSTTPSSARVMNPRLFLLSA